MRACGPEPTVATMFPTVMTLAQRTWPVAAPARRLTFSMFALALAAAAALLLSSGASSATAQAPRTSGPVDSPPINRSRLVTYHRTGGFLGLDDQLSVARNGLAIRTGRDGVPEEFFLSAADLTELERVLEAADFPSLKPLYRPPFPLSDGFTYTLTYRNKTVVALEGGVPAALERPISVLDRLLDGASA
jgi:hypothetical protein